jgi:predicted phosphodiesterase
MRIAIVSDLHANLQAWNAALFDIRSHRVDQIVCLGDVVGYGPNPAEVLQSVHANVNHFVLGNHDAVVAGKLGDDLFNDRARELVQWTRSRLNDQAVAFLAGLPLSLDAGMFRCSHGDLSEPGAFHYVIDPADALASWETVNHQLLFVGHSHRPAIFLMGPSETPRMLGPKDFRIEPNKRYLVNVGSVGHPRDGDPRACYCIFDSVKESVYWRRIPYDLDGFRAAVRQAALPADAFHFLGEDPRAAAAPLREQLDFSPATSPAEEARDVVALREVDILRMAARRWRNRFMALTGACLVAGMAIGVVLYEQASAIAVYADGVARDLSAVAAEPGANILPAPCAVAGRPHVIGGWIVRLEQRRSQRVDLLDMADRRVAMILASTTADADIGVWSPPVQVQPRTKLQARCLIRKSPDFEGAIELQLVESRDAAGRKTAFTTVANPGRRYRDDWFEVVRTVTCAATTGSVQYRVVGRFKGSVVVTDLSLVRP